MDIENLETDFGSKAVITFRYYIVSVLVAGRKSVVDKNPVSSLSARY